ncbi:cytosine permease [Streptomyces sp. NPDC046909]|uniref:purine-cytosine permease family protein n=1 Tax=Streptomyces sp. NPDC046909 TaxID=3155617 RepID=UPI0033DDB1A4
MTTAPADSSTAIAPAYGDKVIAVETAGSEPIPDAERHGTPLQLLWTWASPNIEFATVYIGVISVLFFGLSFWQATAALLLGTALGSLTQGILSLDGPRFGVPQMAIGRFAFGYRGNLLPSGVNALVAGVGWFAVNSVSAAFALNTLTDLRPLPSLLIVVAAEIVIGFIGHNFVHAFEKYAFPALAVIFLLAGVWTFKEANLGGSSGAGGGIGGFLLAFSTAWGYAAGWNPGASDYSRYLPRTANRLKTIVYPAVGLFVSIAIVAVIGAASATIVAPEGATPTAAFTGHLPGWLSNLVLLAIILGAISANALNVYSSAMSITSLGLKLPPWLGRSAIVVLAGVAGTAAAWASLSDAGHAYEAFLLVIAYWVGPWLGVVLVERWLQARTPVDELAARLNDRAFSNWPGIASLLIGIAVSVPLFSNQEKYVGWVPEKWASFGDITCLVGFVVSAGLYWVLRKSDRAVQPTVQPTSA